MDIDGSTLNCYGKKWIGPRFGRGMVCIFELGLVVDFDVFRFGCGEYEFKTISSHNDYFVP